MSRQGQPPLLNRTTCSVLRVLLNSPKPLQDAEIPPLAQVPYSEVISALNRLEGYKWVRLAIVADSDPDDDGRLYRRRFYTLTPTGRQCAETILGEQ